ncbi:hypothetical protein [Labilithrix luteola]|nr:hypothetical protein [Labilithrix luteola]
MLLLLRPSFIGLVFVGVALVSATLVSRKLSERFDAAKSVSSESCRAFRAEPGHAHARVCNDDSFAPSPWPSFREGLAAIATAKNALDCHDTAGAVPSLTRALQIANELDDRATLTSAVLSARLVSETLVLLERRDALLDREFRKSLLGGVHLRSARHPFEAERIDRLWMLANADHKTWFGRSAVLEFVLVDSMVQNDVVLDAMGRAIAEGNVEKCKVEARRTVGVFTSDGLDASLCPMMGTVVHTSRRLEETRSALANADPW